MQAGQRLAAEDALAYLRGLGATREALGGQLVVAPDVAGWLLRPPEARLVRRDRVEWHARRRYAEGGAEEAFVPVELSERRPCTIHAFFAVPDDRRAVVYLGEAQLTSYGVPDHASPGEMSLTLPSLLPAGTWRLLGGSDGFGVTGIEGGLGAEPVEREIARRLATGCADLVLDDFAESTLTVLANATRAFVMLLRHDDDPGLLAGDPAAAGDETPEAFTLANGQVDEFARSRTATHAQAMACVRSFLRERTLDPGVRAVE